MLEGARGGVVFASLGTLCTFGLEGFRRIAVALGALPQRVIWKLAPDDLPDNTTISALPLAPNVHVRPGIWCKSHGELLERCKPWAPL